MKKFFNQLTGFIQREWFLIVMLATICLIFLLFEFI